MIQRFFADYIREMLTAFPVVAVVGPRQVGKSTLVTGPEIGEGRRYVTLDDLSWRSLAEGDPKSFLDVPGPMTIDEVQLAPGLLREIKLRIDRERVKGKYLLTGSSDPDFGAGLSQVLAGRVGVVRLPPITRAEERGGKVWRAWLESGTLEEWDGLLAGREYPVFQEDRLVQGGFPLSVKAESRRERHLWMDSFRLTYLERDLRRLADIGHLAEFNRLMQITAGQTATVASQAALARDAGLNPATAGRYLSILEASYLIQRIPPYFANIGKRMVKSPKIFWADTGLCCHLLGIEEPAGFTGNPTLRGRILETFVMMEIQALLPLLEQSRQLFFVRTHDGLEVDGLLVGQGRHIPIEIKASRTLSAGDALPIERWIGLNPGHGPGAVLYPGTSYQPLSPSVRAIPLAALFEC